MIKKIIYYFLLSIIIIVFLSRVGFCALNSSQKIKDFEILYQFIEDNSPLIWVNQRKNDFDWLEHKQQYETMIKNTTTDKEFYNALNKILVDFHNGHTHVVSPNYYNYLKEVLPQKPWSDILDAPEVINAYNYWDKIITQEYDNLSIINKDRDNINTKILEKGNIAYLDINSFSANFYEKDRFHIFNFLEEIKEYPYLIIDIRGNSGGTDLYWKNNLIAPLIDKPLMTNFYLAYRSGNYVNWLVDSIIGPGKSFLRVGRKTLEDRYDLPKEINSSQFMDPIKIPYIIFPKNKVNFQGQILLLVDQGVYSSSETLAAFAQATDWATLIGSKTGGAGIGFTPQLFKLPESNLLIRTQTTIGINNKGEINEELATTPDIEINNSDSLIEDTINLIENDKLVLSKSNQSSYLNKFFQDYDGKYGYYHQANYEDYTNDIIDKIEIVGTFHTDKELIKSLLTFKKGDRLKAVDLERSKKLLQELKSHLGITIEVIPLRQSRVRIVVFMEEGSGFVLSPNHLTQRVIQDINKNQISYKHYNINGKMVNGEILYGFGSTKKRELNFSFPWLLGNKGIGNFNIGSFKRQMKVNNYIFPNSKYKFNYTYFNLAKKNYLTADKQMQWRYTYLKENLKYLKTESGLDLTDAEFHNFELAFMQSNYDFRIGILGEHLDLSNNYPYLNLNLNKEQDLGSNWKLLMRGEAGIKSNKTPYNHLYHPGGYDKMISYYQGELTGSRKIFFRAKLQKEFRQNLILSLIGEGIYLNHNFEKNKYSSEAWDTGLSLEYQTPIGIVLYSAYGISLTEKKEDRFYLGIDYDL